MDGKLERLVLRLLEAGCTFEKDECDLLDDAGDLHQAATDAIAEARPQGNYSVDDDRAFIRWLAEPKDDGGSGGGIGNSPLLDLALEFLETREASGVCAGCGSAECACIPVGDEQGGEEPEREFAVQTVETWVVLVYYKVQATSKQNAKDSVEEGHDYIDKEVLTWDVSEWKSVEEQ